MIKRQSSPMGSFCICKSRQLIRVSLYTTPSHSVKSRNGRDCDKPQQECEDSLPLSTSLCIRLGSTEPKRVPRIPVTISLVSMLTIFR